MSACLVEVKLVIVGLRCIGVDNTVKIVKTKWRNVCLQIKLFRDWCLYSVFVKHIIHTSKHIKQISLLVQDYCQYFSRGIIVQTTSSQIPLPRALTPMYYVPAWACTLDPSKIGGNSQKTDKWEETTLPFQWLLLNYYSSFILYSSVSVLRMCFICIKVKLSWTKLFNAQVRSFRIKMEFKKSQIPEDAINAKEIDSIAKFLAHVRFILSMVWASLLTHFFKIDWSEGGIMGLIVFHVFIFLIIITTRKRVTFQGTLFALLRKCC